MASQGGARPGAGRKPNGMNKLSAMALEKAKEGGILPLDFLLEIMRDVARDDAQRIDAAKAAAPYVHAKLSAVDVTGGITVSLGAALDQLD